MGSWGAGGFKLDWDMPGMYDGVCVHVPPYLSMQAGVGSDGPCGSRLTQPGPGPGQGQGQETGVWWWWVWCWRGWWDGAMRRGLELVGARPHLCGSRPVPDRQSARPKADSE